MLNGFEFPPLMDIRKTAEFLLVQVSKFSERACIRAGDVFIAYDRTKNRFYSPSLKELNKWAMISLGRGELYLQNPLGEREIEVLRKHCSQALANAREYEKVLEETSTDPLTGLLNKRAFCARLSEEIARCSRFGGGFCVAFLDVDGLKGINDRYGHLTGDAVLKEVANVVRDTFRRSDIVARFGGDEFVVVLLGARLSQGESALRRLLENLERVEVKGIPLRVSAGIACYPEDGTSAEQLIEAADKRMYTNKASRRRGCVED